MRPTLNALSRFETMSKSGAIRKPDAGGQKMWRLCSTWPNRGTGAEPGAVTCALHEQVGSSMTQSVDLPVARSGRFVLGGDRPVYRLGLGALRLTRQGILGEARDHHQAHAPLRRAPALGGTPIDTADSS